MKRLAFFVALFGATQLMTAQQPASSEGMRCSHLSRGNDS